MRTITAEQAKVYVRDPFRFFQELLIPTAYGTSLFRDAWAPFQAEFFRAVSPSLLAVSRGIKGPLRGFWLERTKGASKDSDVGACLLWFLLFSPRPLRLEAGADGQAQILETYESMVEVIARNPWMQDRLTVRVTRIFCGATRCRLAFLTSDNKTAGASKHGSRPDVTLCNELSHVSNKGFIQTMLDNADKVPTNLKIVCTNAGEVRTWQWDWRERYKEDPLWWFQKVDRPAPWIDEDALADARLRNSTSRYNRLWGGIWTSGEGDALDERDVAAAISPNRKPMTGKEENYIFVSGLDLGIKHDHSALVTLGARMGSGKVRLARTRKWKPQADTGKVDLIAVRAAVKEEYDFFSGDGSYSKHIWIGYDPYQAELMAQDLKKMNLPMAEWTFTGRHLDQMARDILAAFRSRVIELYECPELIDDFYRLSIKESKYGLQKLTAVSDETGHADLATAFAIALPLALCLAQYDVDPETDADPDFGAYDGLVA